MNIVRAGFLDNGVSRIVDQVVEQKMDYIQSKVEEILYKYVGKEQPVKKGGDKQNGSLEVDTSTLLLPADLEQVSPDSDKKSSCSVEIKEEIEEEIIEDDDDFESPAFEPIEPMKIEKSEIDNSHNSNLSEISGLTSQDSAENKLNDPTNNKNEKQDTALSQISSTQDNIPDNTETKDNTGAAAITGISGEEAQTGFEGGPVKEEEQASIKEESKCQFDLNKDVIEFTGTERKSITLDDSTNSGESEKTTQEVQNMDVDNSYENDTTDSSEMRMQIDLKEDDTTQGTANSSKIEDSSQDSQKNRVKKNEESERSKEDRSKSSNKSSKSYHQHSSSSSKSKHDESSRHKSSHRSSTSSFKKSSGDKYRSSCRKDRDKDRKSDASKSSRDKQEQRKSGDDHHQEKLTRRRRSTDHDSGESKDNQRTKENKTIVPIDTQQSDKIDEKPANKESPSDKTQPEKITENMSLETKHETNVDCEAATSPAKLLNDQKSTILHKHDCPISSAEENFKEIEEAEEEFYGFAKADDDFKSNPWYECMQLMNTEQSPFVMNNSNHINKHEGSLNASKKSKVRSKIHHEGI